MKKTFIGKQIALAALLLVSSVSFAAEGSGVNITGLFGHAVTHLPSNNTVGQSNIGFGGRFGIHVTPEIEFGAGYNRTKYGETFRDANNNITDNNGLTLNLFVADLSYHVANGYFKGLFIGPRVGLGLVTNSASVAGVSEVSDTKQRLTVGAGLGYDFDIGSGFVVGPRVSYDVITKIGDVRADALQVFQYEIGLKYSLY